MCPSLTQAASSTLISKSSVATNNDSDNETTPLMNKHEDIINNRDNTEVTAST